MRLEIARIIVLEILLIEPGPELSRPGIGIDVRQLHAALVGIAIWILANQA